jgi:beta-galactosidase
VAPERQQVTDPGYEGTPNQRAPVYTLFPDWNPKSSAPHQENVEVYSNCADVELFLNGQSLGSKALPKDAASRNWRVDYEAGAVRAVCKTEGISHELRTAGNAAKIVLTADKAKLTTDWNDLSYITAKVVDDAGILLPLADQQIAFSIAGPGAIAAVDNADNTSHESFQGSTRKAFHGSCIAIVRANGKGSITIKATAPGLTGGSIAIAGN